MRNDEMVLEKNEITRVESGDSQHTFDECISFYLKNINKFPLLSKEEEVRLALCFESGDDTAKKIARERMITSNLRLVVYVAKRFWSKKRDFDFLDLISEGNIGLIEAVERYNPHLGYRFSSYAVYRIMFRINRAIELRGELIYCPYCAKKGNKMYQKTMQEFLLKKGGMPSDEEIAKMMGKSLKASRRVSVGIKIKSFDASISSEDKEKTLWDMQSRDASERIPNEFLALTERKERRMFIDKALECLTEKEKEVIKLRFSSSDKITFEEVGKKTGATKQATERAEKRALKKMKFYMKNKSSFVSY